MMRQLNHLGSEVKFASNPARGIYTYLGSLVDMEDGLAVPGHLELDLRNLAIKIVPNLKPCDWT